MEDQKVKKSFLQRHKKSIEFVGLGMLVGVSLYCVMYAYRKIYMQGAKNGAMASFQATINWFNEEFPDIKLRELYDEWVKIHPDKMVSWDTWKV